MPILPAQTYFRSLIVSAVLLTFPLTSRAALAPLCRAFESTTESHPLKNWQELRPVTSGELPAEILHAIDLRPVAQKLRERFALGRGLAFQLEDKADFGGWLIQGEYLMKIVSHLFPRATIVEQGVDSVGASKIELIDSTQWNRLNPMKFDMSDLKILNRGPSLPTKAILRPLLNLPADARIISAYESVKSSFNQKELIRDIFDRNLADIVILSSQSEARRHERFSWHKEIPLITSRKWALLTPIERPKRAIIFNETRHRLPYMHAAADAVIVMGQANIFEPIYTRRTTYIDQFATKGFGKGGWERMILAAQRTGLGHPFTSAENLINLLSLGQRREFQNPTPYVNQPDALDTVLRTLENILSANPNKEWSRPL